MDTTRTRRFSNNKSVRFYNAFSLVLLLFLVSCGMEMKWQFTGDEGVAESASLVLNIESEFQPLTLLPDVDTRPCSYQIKGSGPDGVTFDLVTEETTVEISSLVPGTWRLTANQRNEDGAVLSMGEESTSLQPGNRKSVRLTVKPVQGYGTLDVALYWTPADVAVPSVEAQLIPVSGSPIDLSFALGAGSAVYVAQTIPTGNHTLVLKLCDGGDMVMGAVEVVKIMNKQSTAGVFEFLDIDEDDAFISVNITPDESDAITVTLGGGLSEITAGESMSLSASASGVTGNVVYVWYLNGEAKQTGAAYTTGNGLALGTYRLDVTAFSADGKEAGSATHAFSVVEPPEDPPEEPPVEPPIPAEVTLEWDPNSETDIAGYRIHYGTASGSYIHLKDAGKQTACTVTELVPGTTYYFAATAYNTSGLESDYSNEVLYTVPF
jgi:hypothetical protein